MHHMDQVGLEVSASPQTDPPVVDVDVQSLQVVVVMPYGIPLPILLVYTALTALPQAMLAGAGVPSSVTLMGAFRKPSVRSAQLSAIFTPFRRTYGPMECVNRVAGEMPVLVESHAMYVPANPAAAARAWHFASAPASPPILPLYIWLVTKTSLDSKRHAKSQPSLTRVFPSSHCSPA